MSFPRRSSVAVCVAVLLVTSVAALPGFAAPTASAAPSAPAGAGAAVGSGAESLEGNADAIRVRNELRRVETVGEYGVRTRAEIPDRVTELEVTLPDEAVDVSANGFAREDATTWAWDGRTASPTLDYRVPANRTVEDGGPLAGRGEYLFVDAGDWAIVQPPRIGARWRFTGSRDVDLVRETVVDGEGAAGHAMAYIGPYDEYTHEAHGQRFRLIVPAAAEMDESPAAVLEALSHAAGALQVGSRDPEVFLIGAPTADVGWAVRGLQTGAADVWVRDVETVSTGSNVWVHEYVHTRQGYETADSARWFTEATATYYAALFALERGEIGLSEFRRALARGERDPQASSVLARPTTWRHNADYLKGSLVAGEIDRRIRLATGGERSLATVFRQMNAKDGRVTGDDFLEFVRSAGEDGDAAERLTATRAAAETWNRSAHDAAFGRTPARIGFSIDDAGAVRATGEYRDRPVDRAPVRLVAGETLHLAVAVTNAGSVAGEYDLALRVDGVAVASRVGQVAANGSVVERFAHRFEEPGEYEVNAGGRRLDVVVAEPTALSVREMSASSERVTAGETVAVRVTVGNDDPVPGRETVTVRVNGDPVAEETVRLDAGDETDLTVDVTLSDPGAAAIEAGDERATVTVDARESSPTRDSIPGFGPAGAGVALALAAALARRL